MNELFKHLVFWHWFALAILLAICDVLLGANFFFVWSGLSAAMVGMLVLCVPSLSWEYQLLFFGVGVLASLVFWRQYLKTHSFHTDKPLLNRRVQQYVGRMFTLDEPIENGRGKIRVDDSVWRVSGEDMPVGTQVRVVDVDGVILKVEKHDK